MLERVQGLWNRAMPDGQPRLRELCQAIVELCLGHGRNGGNELVAEPAPDGRSDLGHLLDRPETIQARHQGGSQRGGDGDGAGGADVVETIAWLSELTRFSKRPCPLFHE